MAKKAQPVKSETPPPVAPAPLKRPVGARGVVVQLKADSWRAIRQLALDLDTSVQRLGVEAWNDLMAKHGRKVKIEGAWE